MMRCLVIPLVVLLSQAWGDDYVFLFQGKEYERKPQPVFGISGAPAAGDVLWVWNFPVVLAGPGRYEFRLGNKEGTVLLGRLPGEEAEKPVGVRVVEDYEDGKTILRDPLSVMKPEDKAGLRAVVLEEMPEKPDAALQGIDWSKAALVVSETFSNDKEQTLRDLPDGLKYLAFDIGSSPSLKDVSSLSKASELLWLRLHHFMAVNADVMAGMSKLRLFDAGWSDLENAPALGALKEMRELHLGGVDEVEDLGFVSTMPELRRLSVGRTAITSLQPLEGLKKLEEVHANETRVKALPSAVDVPSLKRLTLLSASVPEARIEEFRKALPACQVDSSWHASLASALKDVDRLRVRTGGTCHRDIEKEKTLFEVVDAAEIQRLVGSWKVEEQESGYHCMCCGEPSLEFYKGGKLITTLGFHHGRSLRWPEGWPGDASLTDVASESICDFLARNGLDGPKKELERSRKREAAYHRLMSAYAQLVDETVLGQFKKAFQEVGDPDKVAVKAWPDPEKRAARLFSLYGALPDSTWRLSAGYDEPLREGLLAKVETKTAVNLVTRKDAPEQLLQGLSRWAFFGKEGADFLKALEGESMSKLGAWALAHPRKDNREEALHSLATRLDEPVAKSLLLDFLAGEIEERKIIGDAVAEPDGGVTYLPHQDTPPEGAGEKALCAWLLSKHQIAEAEPLIEKLHADATGADKEAYEKSLKRYQSE